MSAEAAHIQLYLGEQERVHADHELPHGTVCVRSLRSPDKETPNEVEERTVPSNQPNGWDLSHLLVTTGLAESKAEARRLIQQGGVSVDGERQTVVNSITLWKPGMSAILKVGKRRFVRVNFTYRRECPRLSERFTNNTNERRVFVILCHS